MWTFSQHSNKRARRNRSTKFDRVGLVMGLIGGIGLILFCYHYGYVDSQIQPFPSHSAMSRDITIGCPICHKPAPIRSARQAARIFHNKPLPKDKEALEEIDRVKYMDSVLAAYLKLERTAKKYREGRI
jgi:hypothetical protein